MRSFSGEEARHGYIGKSVKAVSDRTGGYPDGVGTTRYEFSLDSWYILYSFLNPPGKISHSILNLMFSWTILWSDRTRFFPSLGS